MDVDQNLWYIIAFFGFFGICFITWAVKALLPNPTIFLSKHLVHPHLHHYLPWTAIQVAFALSFTLLNVAVVILPTFHPEWKDLQSKIALTSVVNLAPLCVGGRAPIIDSLNISRNWYRMFHNWTGLVMYLEAILHSMIALSLRPKSEHIRISGWIVGSHPTLLVYLNKADAISFRAYLRYQPQS